MKITYEIEVNRMTVGELKAQLAHVPDNLQVWVDPRTSAPAEPVESMRRDRFQVTDAGNEEDVLLLVVGV